MKQESTHRTCVGCIHMNAKTTEEELIYCAPCDNGKEYKNWKAEPRPMGEKE